MRKRWEDKSSPHLDDALGEGETTLGKLLLLRCFLGPRVTGPLKERIFSATFFGYLFVCSAQAQRNLVVAVIIVLRG